MKRIILMILLVFGCASGPEYEQVIVKDEVVSIERINEKQCHYTFEPRKNYRLIVPSKCGLAEVGDTLARREYRVIKR